MDVPHNFFKIIDVLLNHNIRLRHKLGDRVRLTSYDSTIVTIQLQTIDGETYLTNGWEQFSDHHNLQDGFVVVFEYNGNSMFNMRIFDHSRSDVTYGSDFEEDEALHLDNLAFEITLMLNQNNRLEISIPGRFARHQLPRYVRNVRLHDSLHQNWNITANSRPNGVMCRLTIGGANFLTEKELQIGDTSIIMLVNAKSLPSADCLLTEQRILQLTSSEILNLECPVLPAGNRDASTPDDAVASAIRIRDRTQKVMTCSNMIF
ncbi:uncharacterized protein LOC111400712 [Olea europaea var. sylvestris]|uniref:uncharacterized protein LOC111400712 n=1 Tax=Olea europaea var. sylvestris TaxID=158386 RepID=UPI000C1CCF60|nr:uncharacterized protein LOC111400712 [Olea europaea var. sylvestris]